MNYTKTFRLTEDDVERVLNPFFESLVPQKHRVMSTWFNRREDGTLFVVLIINDDPHPHFKKKA